jgi:hypothetical protein
MQGRATACACLEREFSGEPDAGNLHVRFDEGRVSRTCRVALSPTLLVKGVLLLVVTLLAAICG